MNPIFNKLVTWLELLDTCCIELPSALDALCYAVEPDGLDDRTWAIGMGGR